MTAKQYRTAIKRIGLGISEAGRFLDVSERAARYYASRGTSGATEILLRVMLAKGLTVDEVNAVMKRNRKGELK